MHRGGTWCLFEEWSWPFWFGQENTQRRRESGVKNCRIPIFLKGAQDDEPYRILVTYFFERADKIHAPFDNDNSKPLH